MSSINDFAGISVLVIGDIILDQYIYGTVNRTSPEADVPVVDQNAIHSNLGGAGNVALNIKTLGANVFLTGAIGYDSEGLQIQKHLSDNQIADHYIISDKDRCTTSKTRIINVDKHVLRVDKENTSALNLGLENQLLKTIENILSSDKIDVVILQDYNKGVLNKSSIPRIISCLNQHKTPFVVDPKEENFFAYKDAFLFKPNLKELAKALNRNHLEITDLNDASIKLREKINAKINLITLGSQGVFLDNEQDKNTIHLKAHAVENPDVCGAGDAVISIAALAIAKKCTSSQIAEWCNKAGYLACTKVGVHPIMADDFFNLP